MDGKQADGLNGAQSVIRTLINCGVEVCFGNPGTSEMHFVAALDSAPDMRSVLCLFEGVVTGAADGYGRIAGRLRARQPDDRFHEKFKRHIPVIVPLWFLPLAGAVPALARDFTWEASARAYVELYGKALNKRAPQG